MFSYVLNNSAIYGGDKEKYKKGFSPIKIYIFGLKPIVKTFAASALKSGVIE